MCRDAYFTFYNLEGRCRKIIKSRSAWATQIDPFSKNTNNNNKMVTNYLDDWISRSVRLKGLVNTTKKNSVWSRAGA